MKKKDRTFCIQADRDAPALRCGHPLPCPWHTAVIEEGGVTVHAKAHQAQRQMGKLLNVAGVLT